MTTVDDQRAYALPCENCGAQRGEKCSEPTDTGRKKVSYIHYARTDKVR